MSKRPSKKKNAGSSPASKAKTTVVRPRSRTASATAERAFTFGRETYIWMGIGFALVLIGMVLMMGGHMPDPNTWDNDIIYSFRRTVLAPIFILSGLIVEVYAIFKK